MNDQQLEFWAIVELFGHQKIAGYVSTATVGGGSLIRVDVPEVEGSAAFTKFYGPNAIYSITPTSEELVRVYVRRAKPAPLNIYMPEIRQLPGPAAFDDETLDDDEPDDLYHP